VVWVIWCVFSPAVAADEPDLQQCRAMGNDQERLACYDKAVGNTYEDSFGQESVATARPPGEKGKPQNLESRVASVTTAANGKLILGLDNGQTWAQLDSPSLKLKVGDQILIRRGKLGSYLLARANGGPEIRVRRR